MGRHLRKVQVRCDPHSLYEHLKVSFMRETLDQPAPKPATRPEQEELVGSSEEG